MMIICLLRCMYVLHISITVPNFSLLSSLTRTYQVNPKVRERNMAEEPFSHTLSNQGNGPAIHGSVLMFVKDVRREWGPEGEYLISESGGRRG
jgi:hypothetical protein